MKATDKETADEIRDWVSAYGLHSDWVMDGKRCCTPDELDEAIAHELKQRRDHNSTSMIVTTGQAACAPGVFLPPAPLKRRVPAALSDVANVLNNATNYDPNGPVGDGVALHSCGGPHFAPLNPKVGDTFYCAIGEVTYVYEDDIGHAGWRVNANVEAHPVVKAKEDQRIRDGLVKLMSKRTE